MHRTKFQALHHVPRGATLALYKARQLSQCTCHAIMRIFLEARSPSWQICQTTFDGVFFLFTRTFCRACTRLIRLIDLNRSAQIGLRICLENSVENSKRSDFLVFSVCVHGKLKSSGEKYLVKQDRSIEGKHSTRFDYLWLKG